MPQGPETSNCDMATQRTAQAFGKACFQGGFATLASPFVAMTSSTNTSIANGMPPVQAFRETMQNRQRVKSIIPNVAKRLATAQPSRLSPLIAYQAFYGEEQKPNVPVMSAVCAMGETAATVRGEVEQEMGKVLGVARTPVPKSPTNTGFFAGVLKETVKQMKNPVNAAIYARNIGAVYGVVDGLVADPENKTLGQKVEKVAKGAAMGAIPDQMARKMAGEMARAQKEGRPVPSTLELVKGAARCVAKDPVRLAGTACSRAFGSSMLGLTAFGAKYAWDKAVEASEEGRGR